MRRPLQFLTIGLIVPILCLLLFAFIAHNVVEDRTLVRFDREVAEELRDQPTAISEDGYKLISLVGFPGLWVLAVGVGGVFVVKRQWGNLLVWIMAFLGGALLNNLLKALFARERPGFGQPFIDVQDYSFPSGHAMLALIGLGLFTFFVWRGLQSRYARILLLFCMSLLIILIGISRLTLGMHYMSDVIAGYAAGGVWLGLCILAVRRSEVDADGKT